jgi:hypothetical protein
MIHFLSMICQEDSKGIGGAKRNAPDFKAVGERKNLMMMTARQMYHA